MTTTQPAPATGETGELESCPFCGAPPEVMRGDEALKPMCRIICRAFAKCKVLPSTAWHRRADEAIAAWNTRVNSHAALLSEREALVNALTCDGNPVNVYTLLDWCADRLWLVANGETNKLGDREGQGRWIITVRRSGWTVTTAD